MLRQGDWRSSILTATFPRIQTIDEGVMQGSCLCGAIEFRVEDIYPKAYQCHCSLCRKQGGASSSLAIIVERETSAGLPDESTSRLTSDQPAFVLTSAPDAVLLSQIHLEPRPIFGFPQVCLMIWRPLKLERTCTPGLRHPGRRFHPMPRISKRCRSFHNCSNY
jgi:hypothetical protein